MSDLTYFKNQIRHKNSAPLAFEGHNLSSKRDLTSSVGGCSSRRFLLFY